MVKLRKEKKPSKKPKALLAVMRMNEADLRRALDEGADPNQKGNSDMTPLNMAVLLCREEEVLILLRAGANPELFDKNNLTALGYAVVPVTDTPLPLLKGLMKSEGGRIQLQESRDKILSLLVEHGANWEAKNGSAPMPIDRYKHYYPEKAEEVLKSLEK